MSWFDLNLKWKILGYFAENSDKEIYVSQLASEINSGKGVTSVILHDLKNEGILKSKKYGNALFYSLNDNFLTRELKVLYFLNKIWESDLINYFIDNDNNIEYLAVYGSHIQGTNQQDSDIDLLVITSSKSDLITDEMEEKLNKKISITKLSLGTWLKLKRKKDTFYQTIHLNHRVLIGDELP
ncbi:MAG: nucleotidyltransferase domain-containing protein [bacterium]|nr:nucleotidyltransferase domain-containing protein [bacterium]